MRSITNNKSWVNAFFFKVFYLIYNHVSTRNFIGTYKEEKFDRASVLVQQVNDISKTRSVFSVVDVPKHVAGKQCPLCLLQNTCLGQSCLGLSGIYIIPSQHNFKVSI